jgi:hypothetical protein
MATRAWNIKYVSTHQSITPHPAVENVKWCCYLSIVVVLRRGAGHLERQMCFTMFTLLAA